MITFLIAVIVSKQKKVYLSSYPSGQAMEVKKCLKYLYEHSNKVHNLIEDPVRADIILMGLPGNELKNESYVNEFLRNNLLSRYPEKVFAVSFFRDNHLFLIRGVYESGIKNRLLNKRVRSGCYLSSSFNPSIRSLVQEKRAIPQVKKHYLFSFIGRNSHKIRAKIFSKIFTRDDILIENSSSFNVWDGNIGDDHWRFPHYMEAILKSKFSLCPCGRGPGSIRLFESMSLGVSPVIISDEWKLPNGPKWKDFSIIIESKDLPHLEDIVSAREDDFEIMGKRAKSAYDDYFADEKYFNYIISECNEIKKSNAVSEKLHWKLRLVYVNYFHFMDMVKKWKTATYKKALNPIRSVYSQMKKFNS